MHSQASPDAATTVSHCCTFLENENLLNFANFNNCDASEVTPEITRKGLDSISPSGRSPPPSCQSFNRDPRQLCQLVVLLGPLWCHPTRQISKAFLTPLTRANGSSTAHNNEKGKEERLKELRISVSSLHLITCWTVPSLTRSGLSLCRDRMDALLDDLGKPKAAQPPRNPTTHWRRRQRRRDQPSSTPIRSRRQYVIVRLPNEKKL